MTQHLIRRDPAPSAQAPVPRWQYVALAGATAALLAVLQLWGNVGDGYVAGWGDHFVLSPEGIAWADPGAFAGDWFMQAAPQPHWFFDIVTFAGQSLGILSFAYALYWMAGVIAFGTATALLAYRFASSAPWAVGVAVTVIAGIGPWMIGGTGSPIIAQALPAVLSANLIYLLLAAMLTERRWLVVALAPAIAVVHVQQGSIALVLVAALLLVELMRDRRIDWLLTAALALTIGFVVFGLSLRPVASNLQDFVRICDQVIPYHCAAHLWALKDTVSALGLIVLCVLSIAMVPRAKRWLWATTVGLATLGYAGGMLVDMLRIPVLGPLAQGVNVYRLGAVLLPFAVWGACAPLLARARGWRGIALLGAWAVGWTAFLVAPGFAPIGSPVIPRVVAFGVALGIPFVWYWWQRQSGPSGRALRVAALSTAVLTLTVGFAGGGLGVRAPNFSFIGDDDLRAWGEEVRDIVPQGEVLIAPPRVTWMKLVTQRAVVADCKNIPYGGTAWEEWLDRLEPLGGSDQCTWAGPLYDDLSVAELVAAADRFDSDFIAIGPDVVDTRNGLEALGWELVVPATPSAQVDLFQRPS